MGDSKACELAVELRSMAEDDVLGMRQDLMLHNMIHPQFIEEADLEKWSAIMLKAADMLEELDDKCD